MENGSNDPFSSLTRMWMEMAANTMQAWQPATGSTASPEILRKGRADLMQVWSDCCEEMMRSSAFLIAQKQCMDGVLGLRKQFRANLRRVQRELQLAGREDIEALLAAIQRSRSRILDQLEETAQRLQSLENTLDGLSERLDHFLETAADAGNGAGKNRRRKAKD